MRKFIYRLLWKRYLRNPGKPTLTSYTNHPDRIMRGFKFQRREDVESSRRASGVKWVAANYRAFRGVSWKALTRF